MGAAAGQIPDEPRVHIAEQQLAALGALARTRNVIEDPLDLRAGKIGVDEQTGLLLHIRAKTVGRELIADGRRAAALPDDRVIDGLARILVPDDRRLSLVCDADCRDILVGRARFLHCLHGYTEHRGPDFIGIVLHPARFGEILGELPLGHRANLPLAVENDRAGTARSLIQ